MTLNFFNPGNCIGYSSIGRSAVTIAIVEENYKTKSNRELAKILRTTMAEIDRILKDLHLVRRRGPSAVPRPPRIKKAPKFSIAQVEKQSRKEHKIRERKKAVKIEKEMYAKRRKAEASKYKTRSVDYAEMTSVRIDKKTVIFIRPGEDPEEAKKKFYKVNDAYVNKKSLLGLE